MKISDKKDILDRYIHKKSLKSTAQRDNIVDTFLKTNVHISLEELLAKVRQKNPKIGYATVYRTMKLLSECGLAFERHFGDGQTRYEHLPDEDSHHDHLICTKCGKIIEFENKRIEHLQKEVADKMGFKVTTHKLELYGRCKECR
ncbi:MAG: transcriptional repressor [Deltaproteobacteria bacterium GWC2_42_11]|nr:MAG: transcriptional repressor [Deltaproteobacteria bacterium GWC2_42_11]HBO83943.1 transcriptional repressor [Deltaproteobacteria bacterium]